MRAGWAVNQWLLYVTGGVAFADLAYSDRVFFAASGATVAGSASDTRAGWTVGVGLEWMFAPQWSVKGEYLYVDIQGPGYTQTTPALALSTINTSHGLRENIVRVGINYHFNGPVVAKY